MPKTATSPCPRVPSSRTGEPLLLSTASHRAEVCLRAAALVVPLLVLVPVAQGSPARGSLPQGSTAQDAVRATPANPMPLGPAPPFSLPSVRDLRLYTRDDFAGKVLLIEIWRTDCAQCQAQASYVPELRAKFASRGFEILGVADENHDPKSDPVERVLAYAESKGFSHPLVLNDGGEFHASYYQRIRGTPSFYLVRRNGELEFLGQDAARPEWRGALEAHIERRLAEPDPGPLEPSLEVRPLPDFTLVSLRGGVIRPEDLQGKPALIAVLSPSLTKRHGPTLSLLDAKYGPLGLRVIGVNFGRFREVAADVAAQRLGYEIAVPDMEAQQALVGSDYIPKFLFVTADGRVLKVVSTVYGKERGIELSVFERYAALLVGKDSRLPRLVDASARAVDAGYRHPELGFTIEPTKGLRAVPTTDGSKAKFAGAGTQDLSVALEVRYGTGAEGAQRVADVLAEDLDTHRVESKGWQELHGQQALVVHESWGSPLGSMRAVRVLVPVKLGIYVVTATASSADWSKDGKDLERAALSFRTGLETGG